MAGNATNLLDSCPQLLGLRPKDKVPLNFPSGSISEQISDAALLLKETFGGGTPKFGGIDQRNIRGCIEQLAKADPSAAKSAYNQLTRDAAQCGDGRSVYIAAAEVIGSYLTPSQTPVAPSCGRSKGK